MIESFYNFEPLLYRSLTTFINLPKTVIYLHDFLLNSKYLVF